MERIPGILQPRPKKCCLVCAMKELRFTTPMIDSVMERFTEIDELADVDVKQFVKKKENVLLTERQVNAVVCESKNLIDLLQFPRWTHKRYCQPRELRYAMRPHGSPDEPASKILRPGQQLLLFYDAATYRGKETLLRNLTHQATQTFAGPGEDPNLLHIDYDKVLIINTKENLINIQTPESGGNANSVFASILQHNHSFVDMKDAIAFTLSEIKGLLVIVIDCIVADEGTVPNTQEWANLLIGTLGTLTDIIVIMTVDVDEARKIGFETSSDVIAAVNETLDDNLTESMTFLDVCQ